MWLGWAGSLVILWAAAAGITSIEVYGVPMILVAAPTAFCRLSRSDDLQFSYQMGSSQCVLHRAPVGSGGDSRGKMCSPQPSQEVEMQVRFFCSDGASSRTRSGCW